MHKNTEQNDKQNIQELNQNDWLLLAGLTVFFFCILYFGYQFYSSHILKKTPPSQTASHVTQTPLPPSKKEKNGPTNTNNRPVKFDFYSMLKKQQPSLTLPKSANLQSGFILQVATVSNTQNAEKLKDHLATLGYIASIQQLSIQNKVRFKVVLGPYRTKSAARFDQKSLFNQEINSLLISPQT